MTNFQISGGPQSIGGPKIARSNSSVGFSSQTGSSQTVKITNPKPPNDKTLTWVTTINYSPSEPQGWLQVSPNTGSLDAGATSGPIQVIVNKTNLTPRRTYTATVVFKWNSFSTPGDTLEVTFTA